VSGGGADLPLQLRYDNGEIESFAELN
jgi:hypothetical protein